MLPNWISAIVFGLIEGLTEFIPVSSTGHLLLAQVWLPRQSDLFNVVIQSGAVLAVLPLFKDRLLQLKDLRSSEGRSLLTLISIAFFVTAIGGLVLEKLHFKLPENPKPVALALIIGGVLFLVSERIFPCGNPHASRRLRTKNLEGPQTWRTGRLGDAHACNAGCGCGFVRLGKMAAGIRAEPFICELRSVSNRSRRRDTLAALTLLCARP